MCNLYIEYISDRNRLYVQLTLQINKQIKNNNLNIVRLSQFICRRIIYIRHAYYYAVS